MILPETGRGTARVARGGGAPYAASTGHCAEPRMVPLHHPGPFGEAQDRDGPPLPAGEEF